VRWLSALFVVAALAAPASALAAGPAPLSADTALPDLGSSYGSGAFGTWGADADGLPRYRYSIDEQTAPFAAQPELNGRRQAWHQLGNDHIVADAFNDGYTQLWSQDHLAQWANYYDEANRHYGGGFGWLVTGGKASSSLYLDRAPGAPTERDFGLGYARHHATLGGIEVTDDVYAPFGDDPLLLHDVVLHNPGKAAVRASWIEYWDVNPYFPGSHSDRGTDTPTWDAAHATLSTRLLPTHPQDTDPLTVFAAAVAGPVDGFETDATAFFGAGTRAQPAEVTADHLGGTLGGNAPDGNLAHTMFALRSPVTIPAGGTVTLRYAYGMARPEQVAPLVARYRAASDPLAASQRAWRAWVPRASFGGRDPWLSRELAWDAYMVRSGTTYEECAHRHIISQGGYYQYDLDFQGAFRDPLQHMLPMIYSDPALARDVLLYSAAEQPTGGGPIPYARISGCARFDLGTSDDLDLWLLLASAEYGLATRDLAFFDQQVPWEEGGTGTLWDHLKGSFRWQETQIGPHGGYVTGTFGDWSDLSTPLEQMTESMLVAAQAAYIYPRLAELADARHDSAFAAQLRAAGKRAHDVVAGQWVGRGWYSRGYRSGGEQMGTGAIFGEPQPWALLAGIPDPARARTLVANIRRFLTGIGAPGGPSRVGSSQSPARNDPDVTEKTVAGNSGVGDNHAVYVGGQWFAVNGWLTWALGTLDGLVPGARDDAFDELERNTLATRATVYPQHWDGILSVDDACRSWYSTNPSQCGVGLSTNYDTQIMHQPAWSLFDVIKLAGIEPGADGYRVVPHLPMTTFNVRLPGAGVAQRPRELRGYVRPEQGGTLRMRVAVPPGAGARALVAYANGRRVTSSISDGLVVFDLPATAGQDADWAVVAVAPSRSCTSRRRFTIRLPRGHVRRATVRVDGRRARVRRAGGRLVAIVDLRRFSRRTVRVRIVETLASGRRFTTQRVYHPCTRRQP
jgi:hypothetical protein